MPLLLLTRKPFTNLNHTFMKKHMVLFAFTLFSIMLNAQTLPSVPMAYEEWTTTLGTLNFFYQNVTKTDGQKNVYIAGATMSGSTTNALIAKYDPNGHLAWQRMISGLNPNGIDYISGMIVTPTDVYITGAITNNTTTPETDALVMRLSATTGSVVWSASYTGAAGGNETGKAIVQDASGDVYISGATFNPGLNYDFLTAKFSNSTGSQLWAMSYGYSSNLDDAAIKAVISGSNVAVTGAVTSSAGNYKLTTLTYAQSNGSLTATNVSTAVTTSSVDIVTDFTSDASGNIIIVGATTNITGQGTNMYAQKLNGSLVTAWTYTFNGTSSGNDRITCVASDASSNIYFAGSATSSTGKDITLIKLNSSGVNQYTQYVNGSFNGDDEAADLVLDASANVYLTGFKTVGTNNKNYYTAKFNSSGTKIWEVERDFNGLNDYATNMCLDTIGNVIITGQSETSSGVFSFLTVRYVQKDVITPTDFNGETPAPNFMYFPNRGQIIAATSTLTTVPDVKFYTKNTNPTFYFKNKSQSFVFTKIDTARTTHSDTLHRIDLTFTACNENSETFGMNEQAKGYLNYFLPYTGANGIVSVKGNQQLITPNLYNNIDLMCSSNQNGIKYYFIVKPGGDMRNIQMEFTGATSYSLNGTTNALSLNTTIGRLTYGQPKAYQLTSSNATVAVTSFTPSWQTNGASNKYKFNAGTYTSSLTLVIEVDRGNAVFSNPVNIQNIKWSTYLGEASTDMVNKVKTDPSNNLYALGQSYSANFPVGTNANVYSSANAGSLDGFVSKFSSVGELIWSTFVGGTLKDNLVDVAFDVNQDLYCVGNTNSNNLFTILKSGADNDATFHGPNTPSTVPWESDGFIFQLKQNGLLNPWLRYYGGSGYDAITACAMDFNGNFFITGYSRSNDITAVSPTGSYTQTNTHAGVGFFDNSLDGFIVRFNASSVATWATYVGSATGSNVNDALNDIAIMDGLDGGPPDIYVTGYTHGSDYPIVTPSGATTYAPFSPANGIDMVITRFTNTGHMVWSTCLGGTSDDMGYALAYHFGKLYVTGYTYSSDYRTINSGTDYLQSYGGGSDAVFVKASDLNVITHSTFVGGTDDEAGYDIALDNARNTAYMSGISRGSHFPVPSVNPANTYNQVYAGGADNFICALRDNRTSIAWATYVGGTSDEVDGGNFSIYFDYHQSVCVDNNNNLYLGGLTRTSETQATPFPLDNNGGSPTHFEPTLKGPVDGTITRFDLVPIILTDVKETGSVLNNALIYPNPASNRLFVKLNSAIDNANYKIVNAMGQIVASGNLSSDLSSINVEKLSEGFYIIELINNNSKFSAKFIKHD